MVRRNRQPARGDRADHIPTVHPPPRRPADPRGEQGRRTGNPVERPRLHCPGRKTFAGPGSRTSNPASCSSRVAEQVFPFLRQLGGDGVHLLRAHEGRPVHDPHPGVAGQASSICSTTSPWHDRDTNGDLYEYMLGKIATAGQNGQFRTPRHIIQLMVEMTAPRQKT